MSEAQINLLQRMPVFAGVKEEVLDFLLHHVRPMEKARGEYFLREGDPGHSLFVLQSGRAVILKEWEGREYVLRQSGPGDCFGEMSLLDLGPRSASVRAVEASVALEITAANLHQVYERAPAQFALIHMNMGREVSRRLREANRRLFEAKVQAGDANGRFDLA